MTDARYSVLTIHASRLKHLHFIAYLRSRFNSWMRLLIIVFFEELLLKHKERDNSY